MDKLEIKASFTVDETGTITGIAWPFGSADRVGDVIHKGAFKVSAAMPILFEHDPDRVVGTWESVNETDAGLEVKGRLFVDGVPRARDVYGRLRNGRVNGLSIGFRAGETKARPGGGRDIYSLHVSEISIVANPCHPDARIHSVKSAGGAASPEKEIDMENAEVKEEQPEPKAEAKAEPVIDKKEFDAMKGRLDKLEAKSKRPVAANNNHPIADNDNERKAFESTLRSTSGGEKKTLTITAPGTGGDIAPPEFYNTIIEKLTQKSPVRALASTMSMGGPLLQIPRLVDPVTPGSVTETGTKPESEPTFEQIDLKPFEQAVIVPVSQITLEDNAVNLSTWLANHIASRFGKVEASWFVTGDGTTQAEGVLTSAEVQEFDASGAALTTDDLIDAFYSIASEYAANGAWLMNRKTMAAVRKLRDGDGNLIWQSGLQAGQPPLILGRPVYEGVDMPDPDAEASPIVFGDFAAGYTIADRVGFQLQIDSVTAFENGIVKFGARRRVGGRVVLGEALTKITLAAA